MAQLLDPSTGHYDRRAIHAKALHHYRRGFSPAIGPALAYIWREARGRRDSTRVRMDLIAAAIRDNVIEPGRVKQ